MSKLYEENGAVCKTWYKNLFNKNLVKNMYVLEIHLIMLKNWACYESYFHIQLISISV